MFILLIEGDILLYILLNIYYWNYVKQSRTTFVLYVFESYSWNYIEQFRITTVMYYWNYIIGAMLNNPEPL